MLPAYRKSRNYPRYARRGRGFENIYFQLNHNRKLKQLIFMVIFIPPLLVLAYKLFDTYGPVRQSDIKIISLDVESDMTHETQGAWSTFGWKYYKDLDSVISNYHITAEDILHGRLVDDPDATKGFWVVGYQIVNNITRQTSPERNHNDNFIRLQDFQYSSPVETYLGLRIYIEGDANLNLKFLYGKQKLRHKVLRISPQGRFFNLGFCHELVQPPFRQNIHEVEMEAQVGDDKSFVVIDRIAVAIAKKERSKHLIYTMMPDHWCHNVGNKINPAQ